MRIITIDARKLEPFEIGAWLMAILAFPDASEIEERNAAQRALCTEQLFVTAEADAEFGEELQQRYPRYSRLDESTIRKRLRKRGRDIAIEWSRRAWPADSSKRH